MMLTRWPGEAIQAASIWATDMPLGPLRMFSATALKEVPPSRTPRSWWVSDWFCAIQFAHDCANAFSAALAHSWPRPAEDRSPFMALITLLLPPSHTGAGAGAGGTTCTGVGGSVGGGGGGGGAVVVVVVVEVEVVVLVVV